MPTETKTPTVELQLTDVGDLTVTEGGRERATIRRRDLTPASRKAAMAFLRACSELKSIDELEPGENVIAADACMLLLEGGLPFTVLRGQRIDNPVLIEMLLRDGRRLLHEGAELEIETMLREIMTTSGYTAMAQSQVVLKRALASRGNA
jgi:hypothetical protein